MENTQELIVLMTIPILCFVSAAESKTAKMFWSRKSEKFWHTMKCVAFALLWVECVYLAVSFAGC